MEKLQQAKEVITTFNASGALRAASQDFVVVIVDVIDMSTSIEAALEKGAIFVLGASPDISKVPVYVNPYKIGLAAGSKAKDLGSKVIIITEPRWGEKWERENNCQKLISGINDGGGQVEEILPNIGAEVGKMLDFKDKVVVCVSDTGGVAFDAAWQMKKDILTGTIARTMTTKGKETALLAAKRAINLAKDRNIAIVAASANSLEDVLGASFIAQTIIELGYLNS
ncbi:MAG: hypothetical protein JM58_14240 [Peptococcaceae bacterium BICA1-8]|nr:MAG: hypothetical protein JM58_14240 [Peptococcaceae bacterium BICA1-8]